ncbi:MAG: GNAT family N-acetyltransferase [candidate division Zixibacteria bacterium]|nr:GNAT family N-acetyltransferase [candidate division Zixibacteria bacterium]
MIPYCSSDSHIERTEKVCRMTIENYRLFTARDIPDLGEKTHVLTGSAWPEFMLQDPLANEYFGRLYVEFPYYQFVLMHPETEEIIALGNSIPLAWDRPAEELPDEGWDWAIAQGFRDREAGLTPTVQCALQVVVKDGWQGNGLSASMVRTMKSIGRRVGLSALIAPVRPNRKCDYPLTPMERYVHWRRDDGLPFDPWMRVHARLGAEVIRPCMRAMYIPGTIADWESWTGMTFPDSGRYVIPKALVPIDIDRDRDQGLYVEPNVWMRHPLNE